MSTLLVFHPEAISSPMLALRFLQDQTIQKLIDFPSADFKYYLNFLNQNNGCYLNEKKRAITLLPMKRTCFTLFLSYSYSI